MLEMKKQEVIRQVERSLMKERLTQGMGRLEQAIGSLGKNTGPNQSRNGAAAVSSSVSGTESAFSKESSNVVVSGKALSLVQAEFFGQPRNSARTRGL